MAYYGTLISIYNRNGTKVRKLTRASTDVAMWATAPKQPAPNLFLGYWG